MILDEISNFFTRLLHLGDIKKRPHPQYSTQRAFDG